ncbi:MAG: hypothetical protein ACYDDO_12080 [Acidiferrobacterales bacterium]
MAASPDALIAFSLNQGRVSTFHVVPRNEGHGRALSEAKPPPEAQGIGAKRAAKPPNTLPEFRDKPL